MRNLKKLIALGTAFALLGVSTQTLSAQDYSTDVGGEGYVESRRAPALTPAIALGAIAAVAVIAVAVQSGNHHGHGHSHD